MPRGRNFAGAAFKYLRVRARNFISANWRLIEHLVKALLRAPDPFREEMKALRGRESAQRGVARAAKSPETCGHESENVSHAADSDQPVSDKLGILKKIISGGQTGVDRAALDFAIEHDIPHGGWCPKDRKAEDGPLAENTF